MESVTAAPPAAAEIEPNPVAPAADAPTIVHPPSPPPAETKAPEQVSAPSTEKKPDGAPEKKPAKGKKEEPARTEEKKDEPKSEEPESKSGESEVKSGEPSGEVKTEAESDDAPKPGELTEEQNADLTAAEKKGFKNLTEKEIRAVFNERGKAESRARKLGVENEKLLKEVKRVATLEAQVKELEKRPTTEANDARIKVVEDELAKRKADLEEIETKVKEREENVRLREYATEVRKTPDYQKYVTEPTTRMLTDLSELCRSASENDEEATKLDAAVRQALGHDDKAIRARELKKVVAELGSFEQTAFRGILDQFNTILNNETQLAANAEVAKKTVTEHRTKEEAAKRTERVTKFQKADGFVRSELEKEVPFLTMDLTDFPHYQKIRDEWEQQRVQFAKDIEAGDVSPETIATLHEMAGSYQLAKIVSKDFQAQILDEKQKLEEKLAAATKELNEIKAKEQKDKDDEEEEEKEADEVTPSLGNGRESGAALPTTFTPGEGRGTGKFSSAVYSAPDK